MLVNVTAYSGHYGNVWEARRQSPSHTPVTKDMCQKEDSDVAIEKQIECIYCHKKLKGRYKGRRAKGGKTGISLCV